MYSRPEAFPLTSKSRQLEKLETRERKWKKTILRLSLGFFFVQNYLSIIISISYLEIFYIFTKYKCLEIFYIFIPNITMLYGSLRLSKSKTKPIWKENKITLQVYVLL